MQGKLFGIAGLLASAFGRKRGHGRIEHGRRAAPAPRIAYPFGATCSHLESNATRAVNCPCCAAPMEATMTGWVCPQNNCHAVVVDSHTVRTHEEAAQRALGAGHYSASGPAYALAALLAESVDRALLNSTR